MTFYTKKKLLYVWSVFHWKIQSKAFLKHVVYSYYYYSAYFYQKTLSHFKPQNIFNICLRTVVLSDRTWTKRPMASTNVYRFSTEQHHGCSMNCSLNKPPINPPGWSTCQVRSVGGRAAGHSERHGCDVLVPPTGQSRKQCTRNPLLSGKHWSQSLRSPGI